MARTRYYCHTCAVRLGIILPFPPATLNATGTDYQLRKFIKHTMPTDFADKLSIFNTPEYQPYLDYTVSGAASGCAQIDQQNRTNIIWYAGRHTGMTFVDGKYFCPDDSVKVVLHHDLSSIHAFPANYELEYIGRCEACGSPIPL
jgi:hypothetical protein